MSLSYGGLAGIVFRALTLKQFCALLLQEV